MGRGFSLTGVISSNKAAQQAHTYIDINQGAGTSDDITTKYLPTLEAVQSKAHRHNKGKT